jgi:predicted ThiF/HesA family dinucleotide-utilizing enzyme
LQEEANAVAEAVAMSAAFAVEKAKQDAADVIFKFPKKLLRDVEPMCPFFFNFVMSTPLVFSPASRAPRVVFLVGL